MYKFNDLSWCHDDRLSVFKNISGQQAEKHEKNNPKHFQRQKFTNNLKKKIKNGGIFTYSVNPLVPGVQ